MQMAIIAYIAIFVILIIFVYFTYGIAKGGNAKTTTIPKTTTISQNALTTTIPANLSSSSTTTIPQGSCLSSAPTVPIYNGNFGTGTYAGWNQTGGGFGLTPYNLTYANRANVLGYYNHTWTNYVGTFFASTYHGGLGVQPGNLTSAPFKVTEPYLNFRIISPQTSQLFVQIMQGNVSMITTHYNTYVQGNPYPTSQFLNATIPLSSLLCQNVSIRLVAQVVGGYTNAKTYIAAGDFVLSKTPVVNPGVSNPSQIIVNQSIKGVNS